MIFKNKQNSRTFKHSHLEIVVFLGFQGLEKALVNFKYYKSLKAPVRIISILGWPPRQRHISDHNAGVLDPCYLK